MNQRLYRVFHLQAALITALVSGGCAYFGYIAIRHVMFMEGPDEFPFLLLGLILACISILQFFIFAFAVFGRYRLSVNDDLLEIKIGVGPFSKTHNFWTPSIDFIFVADNGTGGPAVGILADRAFRFGSFLPKQTVFEAVEWLQQAADKTKK
jgi:hypothetical protein